MTLVSFNRLSVAEGSPLRPALGWSSRTGTSHNPFRSMILETGGSFRTNTQEQWSELGALPKKVLQHRATLRTMAIAKDLGTMAERNRTTRQQAKLTIGSAPVSR